MPAIKSVRGYEKLLSGHPHGPLLQSERQFQVRCCLPEYPAEIVLYAFQSSFAIRLETQHDHRCGVAGARQPESVAVFDT
jgi:hypothetical protein